MEIPTIWVFTHDSIGVGEDGPTHQPVEQLASLRAIPGLIVLRPADANEVVEAWRVVMQLQHEPAVLVLARGAVPTVDRTRYASAAGLAQGAYVLADAQGGPPEVLLLGTGSEVALCLAGLRAAHQRGRACARRQHALLGAVRETVAGVPRQRAAAAGHRAGGGGGSFGFRLGTVRGQGGAILGMQTFGASAPLQQLLQKFGFTQEHVVAAARAQLARARELQVGRLAKFAEVCFSSRFLASGLVVGYWGRQCGAESTLQQLPRREGGRPGLPRSKRNSSVHL